MEERRQKEEGQKRKGTERREKGERRGRAKDGKRTGETATRHATERHIPDAGKQEKNRKRIPRQEAGNGSENAIFCLMPEMTAGRRIFLHFRFPFALVNMGRVVNHISPFFSPSPSWHERLLPPLPSPSFFVSRFSFMVYFNTIIWYHCIVLKEEKRRKKKC